MRLRTVKVCYFAKYLIFVKILNGILKDDGNNMVVSFMIDKRKIILTYFLVVGEHDTIIVQWNFAHCHLNLNERDFSNTFCNRLLAEADKRGVAFNAFSSALSTKSSAVAPSRTGIFFIVMAIIVHFLCKCTVLLLHRKIVCGFLLF